MGSWKDDASEAAQAQLNELLNRSIHHAQQALAKGGAFASFALALTAEGTWHTLEPGGDGEADTQEEELARVTKAVVGRRDVLSACAIVTTRPEPPRDDTSEDGASEDGAVGDETGAASDDGDADETDHGDDDGGPRALHLALEHAEGAALACFLPFECGDEVTFGQLRIEDLDASIWT